MPSVKDRWVVWSREVWRRYDEVTKCGIDLGVLCHCVSSSNSQKQNEKADKK